MLTSAPGLLTVSEPESVKKSLLERILSIRGVSPFRGSETSTSLPSPEQRPATAKRI
jgi:hypothetical protein